MPTITEALAEVKTIGKRIQSKRSSVMQYLVRQEALRDPLAAEGGSQEFVKRERQAIGDLEQRIVAIRRAIAEANAKTELTIGSLTMPLQDWLTFRREVAPGRKEFLAHIRTGIQNVRQQAMAKGWGVVQASAVAVAGGEGLKPNDVLVNVSETELAKEIEDLEAILGQLDGQLSLKNATTQISI